MECRTSQRIVWIRAPGIDLFFSGFLREMGTPIFRLLHNVLKHVVNLDEVVAFETFLVLKHKFTNTSGPSPPGGCKRYYEVSILAVFTPNPALRLCLVGSRTLLKRKKNIVTLPELYG